MSELPLVYMSTESGLKHRAIAAVMKREGMEVEVRGKKLESGVPEQPYSLDESLEGARNRQEALRRLGVAADFLVTVESGLHPVGGDVYGCVAVLIERPGKPTYTGLSIDLQYPQEVLDVVPSQYPDVGTWAMEVKGAKEKDPYSIFTGGRRTRQDTIEDAARNALISLLVSEEQEN
jgi:non-canonical (house-cleaning) NTP pyrophosphatase